MQRLIIFLIFLVASVWFGMEVLRHPGYLLVVYQPWAVQMPLWFALLSLIVFIGLFYFIIDSIDRFQFLWFRLKNWLRTSKEHQSYSKTQQGLLLLIEAQWKKAERLLLAGKKQTVEPLINYLAAAKAAHEQKANDRRDHYLKEAHRIAPHAQLAIGLTQASLELSQDKLEQAAATLNHLRQLAPTHPQVLKRLEEVYVRLADWQHLLDLLPLLRKAKIIRKEQINTFTKNIYCEIFRAAQNKSLQESHQIWNHLPRPMKKNPDLVLAYIKCLLHFPDTAHESEALIRHTLKYHWQPDLVKIYGKLSLDYSHRQLTIVGAWLKIHGLHPELLTLLGKICVQLKLWGKAKEYFDKCLAQGPYREASLEYGKLLEELGKMDDALSRYREGLENL